MPPTVAPPPTFELRDIDGAACGARWESDLAIAIKEAFAGARFMPGFGPESPLDHTRKGLTGPDADSCVHIMAEAGGRIVGATFRVPIVCPAGTTDADPGWFFVAHDLPAAMKAAVVDALVGESHRVMKAAGFTRVVTKMGTRDGAVLLRRRHDYVHAPTPEQDNRYIREL
jgi:hypothetical protein